MKGEFAATADSHSENRAGIARLTETNVLSRRI